MRNDPAPRMDVLIKDITNLFEMKNGEYQLKNHSWTLYSELVNLLYSFLLHEKMDREEPAPEIRAKLFENKLLFGRDVGKSLGSELKKVFSNLKKHNRSSYKDFKKEFSLAIDELSKKGQQRYSIVYPLNLQLSERIDAKIDEKEFEIIDFDQFIVQFKDVRRILNEKSKGSLKGFLDRKFSFFCDERLLCRQH